MRALAVLMVLVACDDATIDPADVTTANLRGRWERKLDPAGENRRVWSFRDSGPFHPKLDGKSDVLVVYDTHSTVQRPVFVGTYHVENGVIVQDAIWNEQSGDYPDGTVLRTNILGLTVDKELSIQNTDGAPSVYEHIDECTIDLTGREGWRDYRISSANVYNLMPGGTVGVAFDATGHLVAGNQGRVFRYDGECVPEMLEPPAGDRITVRETAGGVHLVMGWGPQTGTVKMPSYAKLATGDLKITERPLPIDGRYFVDMVDVAGKAVMLFSEPNGPVTVVRDDGSSFSQTVVQPVPTGFSATSIVASGSYVTIAGIDQTSKPYVIDEDASGFTTTQISTTAGVAPAIAMRGSELWVIYDRGSAFGTARIDRLYIAKRTGGTWTTMPFSFGAGASIVAHGDKLHVATGVDFQGRVSMMYTLIDGDKMTQDFVMPRAGNAYSPFDQTHGLPGGIAVAADGTVAVSSNGFVSLKKPGDAHDRGTAKVTINVTGSGRVTSTDGVVDCTTTCTVTAPVGRRLLLRAEPSTATFDCPGYGPQQEMCDVEVSPINPFDLNMIQDVTMSVAFGAICRSP